ncbi:DUF6084 family protein [Nonomuraea jiangxiensis]|uniref:Uncharacterized protein n=1 Tax=Nonomuraea jiangxiensis TaxID=633440 RepID=A0A1G8T746_9ACTN|nr:DUF6084 family protein [Nonomuraea jiangxiensis]SDJ37352.1 hypothetical protein SAMN05421869_11091 [Nonomuraea jiangxiensis]
MSPTSPELKIEVRDAVAAEPAAAPALSFPLRIDATPGVRIRALTLSTQLRIDAPARAYDEHSQRRLKELFGEPESWGRNLSSLLWTQTVTHVPAFTGSTVAPITVPCTYDFDVAAAKYLHNLPDGEVPLRFLFTGTVFYLDGDRLQAAHLPWDTEADFRMPVTVWQDLMERHFPRTAWIRLERDTFDRLYAHRVRHTLLGWDDAVRSLLETSGG